MKRRPLEEQNAEWFIIIGGKSESLHVDWRDSICQCHLTFIANNERLCCARCW
ncbi:hypothetical protein R8871_05715 [Paraburkholderia graminis C4D1M]|uniref:Uncharacterized protein n=1 Tax=Paraburkholderia graminis (strain ATCC 700544 / DSM 17151 / LMG 18924 / NCIMB 13744 / C4D1M) TaxID=396598 RepID=B1FTL9_PARG4|nr:hypothetical protein BgramDRAFT_0345 [Paraburkholderia graminis C4D1M]MDR6472210.1 hypothetical protein [Paraburkholderia graminis]CAB3730801.1 hypothetical protein R8871_05715 [Paraburkholderia graminis C4D1M]